MDFPLFSGSFYFHILGCLPFWGLPQRKKELSEGPDNSESYTKSRDETEMIVESTLVNKKGTEQSVIWVEDTQTQKYIS